MNDELIKRVGTPHKFGDWLLKPSYCKGDFDSHSVDVPHLFWHDGRYRMFYIGFDGVGYRTGLASSDDLVAWQREGVVVERGEVGSATQFSVSLTSVLRDDKLMGRGETRLVDRRLLGTWHGYPDEGQEQGKGYFGIAWGEGLQNWELGKIALRAEDGAAWERGGIYKPCLMEHAGRYYVFYNAKESLDWPWREQIGVAWSDDLQHWTRHKGNPVVPNGPGGSVDEIFTADPCVLKHGDTWVMFYYGLSADGHARELVAFSDDLLNWRKGDEVLVDVGEEGSIDSLYAHKPGVIAKDGVLYHYYGAARPWRDDDPGEVTQKDRRGIGLATSEKVVRKFTIHT